jgi:acyl dehydratase
MSHQELWSIGARQIVTVVEDLRRTQIVQYAGASGDFNPLHTDEIYATGVSGVPTVMAHGMLTMGLTGRALTDHVPAEAIVAFGGRFSRPVWPGDSLFVEMTTAAAPSAVAADGDALAVELTTRNQEGTTVFLGRATLHRTGY